MTPNPDTQAIDAEVMARASASEFFARAAAGEGEADIIIDTIRRAIQSAKAEGAHFLSYFESLAKINPAANHALDTARREWAKKIGEGA